MSTMGLFIDGSSLADDSQNYLGNLNILVFLGRLGPGKLLLKVPQEVVPLLCVGFSLQSKMTLMCC